MRKIVKGVQFICSGIIEIFVSILRCIVLAVNKLIRKYRRWRLKRATAYVNRYGFELELNSRVKVAGKAYYVVSYERSVIVHDVVVTVSVLLTDVSVEGVAVTT